MSKPLKAFSAVFGRASRPAPFATLSFQEGDPRFCGADSNSARACELTLKSFYDQAVQTELWVVICSLDELLAGDCTSRAEVALRRWLPSFCPWKLSCVNHCAQTYVIHARWQRTSRGSWRKAESRPTSSDRYVMEVETSQFSRNLNRCGRSSSSASTGLSIATEPLKVAMVGGKQSRIFSFQSFCGPLCLIQPCPTGISDLGIRSFG